MEQERNNLVFFAIGEMYNKQCLFAILSLLNVYDKKFPASIHVYIYTDDPEYFSLLADSISLNLIPIDQGTIDNWLAGEEYFYITKILLVKNFLTGYPGNMIFVDTDVIFKKKIDSTFRKIAEGKYVLHLRESKLSLPENKHFLDSFQGKKFSLSSGRTISINGNSEMWNSGLIGVSSEKIDVVDDVLDLCKQLIPHSSSKVLEQLAFGLVFNDAGHLVGDHLKIVHYWWRKKKFNPNISRAVDEGYPKLERLLQNVVRLDPTSGTRFLRWFYALHPNGLLRRSVLKASLILNLPIK